MTTKRAIAFVFAVAVALTGTLAWAQGTVLEPGAHDALAPAGPQAARIGELWDLFMVVCGVVFAAVLAGLAVALWRAPRADAGTPADVSMADRHEPGPYRSVLLGVGASIVLLIVLLVASVWTDRALARLPLQGALNLTVTGHQWWWEIRYEGDPVSDTFTTANELHVPVGRPVVVTLRSDDVIHSLWVPALAGKKDLIPGRTATLQFQAAQPGTYRGQCAEFCGFQHAWMAFEVIVDTPAQFAAWAARQRAEAPEPAEGELRRGREVFLGSTCVMCHAVGGTDASARKAPDLTHVGSRTTLAAGTLRNDAESMTRWIRNPQQIKPGVNMPASTLGDADLKALVAWLGSLQ
jgi:cytochrome c oxidase subunit 2